jgi:hypothetical protein
MVAHACIPSYVEKPASAKIVRPHLKNTMGQMGWGGQSPVLQKEKEEEEERKKETESTHLYS